MRREIGRRVRRRSGGFVPEGAEVRQASRLSMCAEDRVDCAHFNFCSGGFGDQLNSVHVFAAAKNCGHGQLNRAR